MYALSILALLPTAFALPYLAARQSPGPSCANLGGGSFDTGYNFTLSAYNITDETIPLSDTGVPLIVGTTNEFGAVSVGVLATAASVEAADYLPSYFNGFNLSAGALYPLGDRGVYTSDYEAYAGQLSWQWSGEIHELSPNAEIYCGIANTDPYGGGNPYPALAINLDADNFYLCQSSLGYNEVVHNATATSDTYDYSTCYPVSVHIIDQ